MATNLDVIGVKVGTTRTAAFTADPNIAIQPCDATSAAFAVTLPNAKDPKVYSSGRAALLTFKRLNSVANAVTITPVASQTIDGAANHPLSAQWSTVTIASNGTNWYIVSRF